MFPPRKDPIKNQDITIIITQHYPTGYKPFIDDAHFSNKTEIKHNDSTDNPRTENKKYLNKMDLKSMKIRTTNKKKIIKNLLKVTKV